MRRTVFGPVAGACLITLALAVIGRAQDPSPSVFRSGVDVVHVDVSVLDKDRKPVRGLTAADFTILEDGAPREIVAFSPVELPAPRSARARREEASWVRNVPADVATNTIAPDGRVVVILFGLVPFANFPIAQRIARATIEALGPDDIGAIVFQTMFFNAKAIHDFTSDKARLLEAVNRPFSVATVPPDCRECCVYDKSAVIADALATIRGRRKSIVYIGPPDDPAPGGRASRCIPMAETTVRKLRAANVTMHELDLAGVQAPDMGLQGPGGGISFSRRPFLPGYLPQRTGGQTVQWDNAPDSEVASIFQESASYYVLAFASSDQAPAIGQTHDVVVRVSRPDVVVQARSGYQVGQTAKAIEAEARKTPLVRSVEAAFPRTDFPVSVSAMPLAVPGTDKATIAVALRVEPASSAGEGAGSEPGPLRSKGERVNVYIVAIEPVYSTIAGSFTQQAELPALVTGSGRADYELLARLDVPPGRYDIRAALDGASGARASVYTTVEVPKFDRDTLSLSGVVLNVSPGALTTSDNPLATLLPVVPTARREFTGTDRVTAFVRIYQAGDSGQRVSIAASIANVTGRVVFEDRREQTSNDYQLTLPVQRLAAGEYLLAIEVTSGKGKASRSVRFRIR